MLKTDMLRRSLNSLQVGELLVYSDLVARPYCCGLYDACLEKGNLPADPLLSHSDGEAWRSSDKERTSYLTQLGSTFHSPSVSSLLSSPRQFWRGFRSRRYEPDSRFVCGQLPHQGMLPSDSSTPV
jgi:hypothetical protein